MATQQNERESQQRERKSRFIDKAVGDALGELLDEVEKLKTYVEDGSELRPMMPLLAGERRDTGYGPVVRAQCSQVSFLALQLKHLLAHRDGLTDEEIEATEMVHEALMADFRGE